MTHRIVLSEFQQWIEKNQKVLYASSSKDKKRLYANTGGAYEVWSNGEKVLETMQPFDAVEKYNSI